MFFGPEVAISLLIGVGLDLAIGWPNLLYQRVGHPVGWLALWIKLIERRMNKGGPPQRFIWGGITCLSSIAWAVALWGGLAWAVSGQDWSSLGYGLLFWPLIAMRSMYEHVRNVAEPLVQGDIEGARHAVSMIVGRDPNQLDEAGIARAAMESLGENTSDGIIAPLFWGLVLGPAGMAAYKAINTMDSLIGHRNARYEWFGKCAARLDDVANLIPARLTGLLFALVAPWDRKARAFKVMLRDASSHRSPNAGWAESALAGACHVRLSGPRSYDGILRDEPWLNGEGADPSGSTLFSALSLYRNLMLWVCVSIGVVGGAQIIRSLGSLVFE